MPEKLKHGQQLSSIMDNIPPGNETVRKRTKTTPIVFVFIISFENIIEIGNPGYKSGLNIVEIENGAKTNWGSYGNENLWEYKTLETEFQTVSNSILKSQQSIVHHKTQLYRIRMLNWVGLGRIIDYGMSLCNYINSKKFCLKSSDVAPRGLKNETRVRKFSLSGGKKAKLSE